VIRYEVTLEVDQKSADALERYMRGEHIPEIFRSGCFKRIHFDRASNSRYRTSYEAESQAKLDRYLDYYAPRLRADFQARFGSGITITRETWTPIEIWE
jgi:hypothetical protein